MKKSNFLTNLNEVLLTIIRVLPYNNIMETNKQYLSTKDLSLLLGVSSQYVRKLASDHTIPATLVGKTWVFDSSIVDNKEIIFKFCGDVQDQKRKSSCSPRYKVLSFFSGAMGLDIGLSKAGLEPMLASEIEPNTRKTILLNEPNSGLIGDINKYSSSMIREFAGLSADEEIDLIVGGPPCQAFSTAGKRESFNDSRGNVFLTFIDRILELKPKYAVIENVRGLLSAPFAMDYPADKGFGYSEKTPAVSKGGALSHIIKKLEEGGYTVSFNLYNAANYGAPQKRERVVIFCSRDGERVPYLNPTNSENGDYGLPKWKTLGEALQNINDSDPEFISFPEKRLKYYRMLKEGQYWKDLPEDLQKEALGPSYYLGGGKTGFLRRLDMNKPSPTLVTDPTMPATDLCHPYLDRPLSIREYMRIQEFPDDWSIFGSTKDKYRQIGNAVPVSLGVAIGKQIKDLLDGKTLKSPPTDFPFSRYNFTDDVAFRNKHKITDSIQLYLF